jgi:type I restriction enzyme, S subunit
MNSVPLGELMADKVVGLDPSRTPDETFELWSIPSFEVGAPEILRGCEIGSAKKCVEPNDVLLSRIVPHIRRAWTVSPKTNHRQIASGEWIVFRDKRFLPSYLRHFLISDPFHSHFMLTVAGVGGSLLRARPDGVAKIEIPLPALDEQRRIASILDQADTLRHKRREALDLFDELPLSIFNERFGDPTINSKRISILPLGDVAEFGSGGTPSKSNDAYWAGSFPWVSPKDMKRLRIAEAEDTISETVFRETNLKKITSGTPLIVVRGMILAHTVPIAMAMTELAINQDMKSIHFNNRILPEFGLWCLKAQHQSILTKVDTAAHGTKRLDSDVLRKLPILVPPISEQRAFAKAIEGWEFVRRNLEHQAFGLNSAFASLQHRAFRGEL